MVDPYDVGAIAEALLYLIEHEPERAELGQRHPATQPRRIGVTIKKGPPFRGRAKLCARTTRRTGANQNSVQRRQAVIVVRPDGGGTFVIPGTPQRLHFLRKILEDQWFDGDQHTVIPRRPYPLTATLGTRHPGQQLR